MCAGPSPQASQQPSRFLLRFMSGYAKFISCTFALLLMSMTTMPSKDPLHGKTLEMIVTELVEHLGWEDLGDIINIRCFRFDPSIKSSLAFLRKTPWARKKVEELYISIQRD